MQNIARQKITNNAIVLAIMTQITSAPFIHVEDDMTHTFDDLSQHASKHSSLALHTSPGQKAPLTPG